MGKKKNMLVAVHEREVTIKKKVFTLELTEEQLTSISTAMFMADEDDMVHEAEDLNYKAGNVLEQNEYRELRDDLRSLLINN